MTNNSLDISIEDIVKYENCRKNIYAGVCKNCRTCIGCKFDLPIEKFRYLNL